MNKNDWMRLLVGVLILTGLAGCGSPAESASPAAPPRPSPSMVSPTQTPSAPLRFFTETFDSKPTGWQITQINGDPKLLQVSIESGRWNFLLGGAYSYVYAIHQPFIYQAVHIEVHVSNRGADRNFTSLICQFDIDKGWYEFDISNDGSYHILYAAWDRKAKAAHYFPLVDGASNLIRSGLSDNVYAATCNSGSLTLSINGEQVHSLEDDEYALRDGRVGIGVSSFDVLPVRLEFDSVTVSAP